MEIKDRMDDLLQHQKEVLNKYEAFIKELSMDDAANENIRLKQEVQKLKKELSEVRDKLQKLSQDHTHLKMVLKEQVINEKNAILNGSKSKIELYFTDAVNKEVNQLKALEASAKNRLLKLQQIARKELQDEREGLLTEIRRLETHLEERIKQHKEKLELEKEASLVEIRQEYTKLHSNEISEKVIEKKKKQNDIEIKIGLSWINKIGIVLLLLGIATAMKYTYSTWFNDYIKGISGFIFGAVLLGFGEWFNRKSKNLFALGLCGGGIAVLYVSIFSGHFILEIISMTMGIILSILVTAASLVLSLRYRSMTICGLSLFGGYLPFFSYVFFDGLYGNQIFIAMGYLFLLNLLVLGVSAGRRWAYINYLSFLLNIPCMLYLVYESSNTYVSIGYSLLTFIMYLGITLTYPIHHNFRLKIADVILLGLNTFINCVTVYYLFDHAGYDDYTGFLALAYSLVYFGLGQVTKIKAEDEVRTQGLFYMTALTFAVLMIPFQFGIEWAGLGWLLEAVLLLTYAHKNNIPKMELGGWIILVLCFAQFMLFDHIFFNRHSNYFDFKYFSITLGLAYTLFLYLPELNKNEMLKYSKKGRILTGYKYFTIIYVWLYLMVTAERMYDRYIDLYYVDDFYMMIEMVLLALITFMYGYGINHLEVLKDKAVAFISIGLYIIGDLICLMLNTNYIYIHDNPPLRILAMGLLIAYNSFVFFNLKYLLLKFIHHKGFNPEFYPLLMGIYLLGITSSLLIVQFHLENINLVISLVYVALAFLYIIYGFKQRFMLIRRFGLGLSILATGKLFIFDLSYLEITGKILAYFAFGFVLLAISFIYQKLKTHMEGGSPDEETA
ncbi:MAG: DUF2339 domain-containing protein [Bacillota bacterium]